MLFDVAFSHRAISEGRGLATRGTAEIGADVPLFFVLVK